MTTQTAAPAKIDESALQALGAGLRGPLVTEKDPTYEDVRKIWNGMIDKRPAAFVRARGPADVIDAVNFAREHAIPVSVRGAGHNIAGTSLIDGGLVIDLSLMKGVHVDPAGQSVRVEPGVTLGDLDRETQAFGYVVPAGVVSETGVSGLTLGGGFGWLTRKWGFTSDHLLSADVVTAKGEFLTASEGHNADLLWALRGGGGNFGVVTSYNFRMRRLGPTVMAGLILYPMDAVTEVMDFFREFTASAPDELSALLVLRIAPPAPFLAEAVHGKPVAGIAMCYAGDVEKGAELVKPLKAFGKPLADLVAPKPFTAHQKMLDSGQPSGRLYYWKSEYMADFSPDFAQTIAHHAADFPSPESSILVVHLGGAAARLPESHSAAANRTAEYIFNVAGAWTKPSLNEPGTAWVRKTWEDARRFSTGGTYVNFITADEGEERVREAYDEGRYGKLVAAKNRYDPANMFRSNQNIKPSG